MKKTITNITIIATFLIIYLLQANFFTWFNIAGIKPNLFVILVLYIALFTNRSMGLTYGVIFGLILDLLIGRKIGVSAIMLGLIGLIGTVFDKNFSKDSRMTIMIMVIGCTIIYEIGTYIINYILQGTNVEMLSFAKILLVEVAYNTILTIILYPVIQKTGYNIEEQYKGNKILTRYF